MGQFFFGFVDRGFCGVDERQALGGLGIDFFEGLERNAKGGERGGGAAGVDFEADLLEVGVNHDPEDGVGLVSVGLDGVMEGFGPLKGSGLCVGVGLDQGLDAGDHRGKDGRGDEGGGHGRAAGGGGPV